MPEPTTTPVQTRTDAPPPWLPRGEIVLVPGRGEFFVRRHVHPDPAAPTVLLLHGWTASADLQFLGAYRALAEHYSFVGIDHRGHGRGFRSTERFELEDVADDAAAVVRQLGIDQVIALGYSMGGPVSLHLTRRHRDLVAGLVVQATALEWRATLRERLHWPVPKLGAWLGSVVRGHVRYFGVPDNGRAINSSIGCTENGTMAFAPAARAWSPPTKFQTHNNSNSS